MKKLLLLLSLLTISFTYAVAYTPANGSMNPFAYDLRSEFDETTMTLTGWFSVNAPSNKITVYAKDSEEIVYKILELFDQPALKNRQFTFSFQGHLGKDFTWYVEVTGTSHNQALFVSNSNKLYYPTSIDIDNNPENRNFGTVFCIEGRNDGANISGYISYYDNNGTGLYVFNADGTKRALPRVSKEGFGVNVERYGWNGGKSLNANLNIGNTTGFGAYRVRVSDDGRIFITSQTSGGEVLYEANKNVFSDTDGSYWDDRNWYRVISTAGNTNLKLKESNTEVIGACAQNHGYCNVYNIYNVTTKEFVAGPNVGFDVRGSGRDLQLLMLSGCRQAIDIFTPSHFYCSEYNLGTAATWDQAPTYFIDELKGYVLRNNTAQVQYDKDGNIWMCQFITDADVSSTDYMSLVKYNKATKTVVRYSAKTDIKQRYHRCGAMRFNNDFTKLAITTRGGSSGVGGHITIYPIVNGEPDFANGTEIDCSAKVGLSMMDFAWDWADNLYVAADHGTGSDAGRCVAIYAMPNNGKTTISTPAASRYAFSTKYSVTWKNLFLNEQDIADAVSPYPDVNIRLWRLLQVEYNEYRLADKDVVYNGENELNQSGLTENRTENSKILLNVANYFKRDDSSTRLGRFLWEDTDYAWLGNYISDVSGMELNTLDRSTKYTEDFINRQGFFTEKGQPESWRPIWVEKIFGLESKISPEEYLPVHCAWREADCFDQIWISGWNTTDIADNSPLLSNTSRPSLWYKFNSVRNRKSEGLTDYTHILAWRKDSPTGPIVYRADEPNMELYATYVEKNIDENDPQGDPTKFDATNDELFKLLDNRRYVPNNPSVAPTHDLTVTRHLAAGMYNTICLPMNINLAGLQEETQDVDQHPLKYKADGSGATVLEFTGVTRTTNAAGENVTVLNFTQVTEMVAGKPYLVKLRDGAEDYTEKMPFTTVSVHADAYHPVKQPIPNTPQDVITFVPTINPTTIPAGSIILVADNRLALTTEEGQMAGLRGYFTVAPAQAKEIAEQAADGRVVLSVKQPVTTSVVDVQQPEVQAVQKILQDGNIYIIRGNEKYTITGNRVK